MRMKLLFLYVPGLSSALDVEARGVLEARREIKFNTYHSNKIKNSCLFDPYAKSMNI